MIALFATAIGVARTVSYYLPNELKLKPSELGRPRFHAISPDEMPKNGSVR